MCSGDTLLSELERKEDGMFKVRRNYLIGAFILLLQGLPTETSFGATDPEKILGAAACSDCHTSEYAGWQASTHFKVYNTLHRSPEAREIARKLSIKGNLRRSDRCMTCHYTAKGTKRTAVSGTSCESCHGAARDWLDLHHTPVAGSGYTLETEPSGDRAARLEMAEEAGLIRPHQAYQVAENCFQCHTVPDEDLVNIGGHTAGSAFELVAWLQGEVRHNFFNSNGEKNREAPKDLIPAQHLRVLYVLGRMLDLEYSLRAAARTSQPGAYADAMKKRVEDARTNLEEIQKRAGNLQLSVIIKEMMDASGHVSLEPGSGPASERAAELVKKAAQRFAARHDGSKLAGLVPLLPKIYKGPVYKGN